MWAEQILRAREGRVEAEKEFLSSTSDEVCELWSGREVVRMAGRNNDMKDLCVLRRGAPPWDTSHGQFDPSLPEVINASDAIDQKVLEIQPALSTGEIENITKISAQSSNIT